MGADNALYVGVYLKLPHKKEKIERKVFRKPNGKISQTKFNPETGEEYKEEIHIDTVWSQTSPYIVDHESLEEDMFWEPAYHAGDKENIFLMNEKKWYSETFHKMTVLDLNHVSNMNAIIQNFESVYKEYIDYYREKCPELEIKFGVVYYAH